ncbi:CPBP family intramembrane glutamic endopeptidase [Bacillus cereus]|uniref:CPBP family intramembrane glutamic endopeptidase n=1 Tax=Bacillus cereus TaxID=1396 RepID=UPI003462450F
MVVFNPFRKLIISTLNIKSLLSISTYIYIIIANLIAILIDKITNLYHLNNPNLFVQHSNINHLLDQPFQIYILSILSLIFITPIYEEILFRGIILNFFKTNYSFLIGLFISSLLFGLFHNYDILYIIFATSMGISFSMLYKKTNSLFPCIIAHITYNIYTII